MTNYKHIKILLFLNLLLVSINILGQETKTSSPKWNADFDLSYQISGEIGSFIIPSFAYNRGKHSFAIGPKLAIPFDRDDKQFGAIFSYKIFPNNRSNKFNFYFTFNIDYYGYHETQISLIGINNFYFHPNNRFYFEYTLGYGFQYAPKKQFYIRFDSVVGKMIEWYTYYDKANDRFTDFALNLQLSLGYRIFKNK